ncbi:MAG: hypothetical protein QF405_12325 [Roseibacillus sp.]|jgi:hypothetical protein|nr:hypothetical protein [Roseibacillus sp.]MDP7308415.1 hypothetical protein [Roseibacillus sp.]HJM63528.1 hypothetical protein [Roseibacillus sp.]|tara:strand:+ start:18727 stop:19149 length:423 start_codon:yes stop_codon:yes gene_type:complete
MKPIYLAILAPLAIGNLIPSALAQEDEEAPKPTPAIELPEIKYPDPVTEEQKKSVTKHREGSQNLAGEQDELSADVQDLIEEQTNEKVIALLEEVEEIMAEVIGSLDEPNTSGTTIAAETEIIEKIFEAAKQRAQQNGGT